MPTATMNEPALLDPEIIDSVEPAAPTLPGYPEDVRIVATLVQQVRAHFQAGRYHVLYGYFAVGVEFLEHIQLEDKDVEWLVQWDEIFKETVCHLDKQASHPIMRDALCTLTRQYAAMVSQKYPVMVECYQNVSPAASSSGLVLADAMTRYYKTRLPSKTEDDRAYPSWPNYAAGPVKSPCLSKEQYQVIQEQCIQVIHDNARTPKETLAVLTGLWQTSFAHVQACGKVSPALEVVAENRVDLLLVIQKEKHSPEDFFSQWRYVHEYLFLWNAYPSQWKAQALPEELSLESLLPLEQRRLGSVCELLGKLILWMASKSHHQAKALVHVLFELFPVIEALQPLPTPFRAPQNQEEPNPFIGQLMQTRSSFQAMLKGKKDYFTAQQTASTATFALLEALWEATWELLGYPNEGNSQFLVTGSTPQENRTSLSDIEGGYGYRLPPEAPEEQQRDYRARYLTHMRLMSLAVVSLRETLPKQAGFRIDMCCHPLYASVKEVDTDATANEVLGEDWGHGSTFGSLDEIYQNLLHEVDVDARQLVKYVKLRSFFFAQGLASKPGDIHEAWHARIHVFLNRLLTDDQLTLLTHDYLGEACQLKVIPRSPRWTYRQAIAVLMYGHLIKDACEEIHRSVLAQQGKERLISLKTAFLQPIAYLGMVLNLYHDYKAHSPVKQIEAAMAANDISALLGKILKAALLFIGEWRERQYQQLFTMLQIPLQDDVVVLEVKERDELSKEDTCKSVASPLERCVLQLLFEGLILPLNQEIKRLFIAHHQGECSHERLQVNSAAIIHAYVEACDRLSSQNNGEWVKHPLVACVLEVPKKSGGTLKQSLTESAFTTAEILSLEEESEPVPISLPYRITSFIHSDQAHQPPKAFIRQIAEKLETPAENEVENDEEKPAVSRVISLDYQEQAYTVTVFSERTLAAQAWALMQLAQLMGLNITPPGHLAYFKAEKGVAVKEGWLLIQRQPPMLVEDKQEEPLVSESLCQESYTHAFLFALLTQAWSTASAMSMNISSASTPTHVLFWPHLQGSEQSGRSIASFYLYSSLLEPLIATVTANLLLLNPIEVILKWQGTIVACNERFQLLFQQHLAVLTAQERERMLASVHAIPISVQQMKQVQETLTQLQVRINQLAGEGQQRIYACDLLVHKDLPLATAAIPLAKRLMTQDFSKNEPFYPIEESEEVLQKTFWETLDFAGMVDTKGQPNEQRQQFYIDLLQKQKPTLTTLNLAHCSILTPDLLKKLLDTYPAIEIVNVSYCAGLDARCLSYFAKCTHLRELYLDGNAYFSEMILASTFFNKQFLQLTLLSLQESPNLKIVDVKLPQLQYLWVAGSRELRYVGSCDGFLITLLQHAYQAYQENHLPAARHLIHQAEALVPLTHDKESSHQWDVLRLAQAIEERVNQQQTIQEVLQNAHSPSLLSDEAENEKEETTEIPSMRQSLPLIYDLALMNALFSPLEIAQTYQCLLQVASYFADAEKKEAEDISTLFLSLFQGILTELASSPCEKAVLLVQLPTQEWICAIVTQWKPGFYQLRYFLDPVDETHHRYAQVKSCFDKVLEELLGSSFEETSTEILTTTVDSIEQSGVWIAFAVEEYLQKECWPKTSLDEKDWQTIGEVHEKRWLEACRLESELKQQASPVSTLPMMENKAEAVAVAQAAIVANDEQLLQVFFKGFTSQPKFAVQLPALNRNFLQQKLLDYLVAQESLLEQNDNAEQIHQALRQSEQKALTEMCQWFEQYYCRHPDFVRLYELSIDVLSQQEKQRANRFRASMSQQLDAYSVLKDSLASTEVDAPLPEEVKAKAKQKLNDLKIRYTHQDNKTMTIQAICLSLWQKEAREVAARAWLKHYPETHYPEGLRRLTLKERVSLLASELSPSAVDGHGISLLQYALQHERYTMAYYLRQLGATDVFLPIAADAIREGNTDLLEVMLDGEDLFRKAHYRLELKTAPLIERQRQLLREQMVIEQQLKTLQGYSLHWMPKNPALEMNRIYVKVEQNKLQYQVISPSGNPESGEISTEELKHPLESSFTLENLKPWLSDILNITSKRGHTFLPSSGGHFSLQEINYVLSQLSKSLFQDVLQRYFQPLFSEDKIWWRGQLLEKDRDVNAWRKASQEWQGRLSQEMTHYALCLKSIKEIPSTQRQLQQRFKDINAQLKQVVDRLTQLQHIQRDTDTLRDARLLYRTRKAALAERLYQQKGLPLHLMAGTKEETVQLLLNIRLPIDSLLTDGKCALQMAIEQGNYPLARFLVSRGAVTATRENMLDKQPNPEEVLQPLLLTSKGPNGGTFLHDLITAGDSRWLYDYAIQPQSMAAESLQEVCEVRAKESRLKNPNSRELETNLLAIFQQPLLVYCPKEAWQTKNTQRVKAINAQHPETKQTLLHAAIVIESMEWLREQEKPEGERYYYYGGAVIFLLRQGADVLLADKQGIRPIDLLMQVASEQLRQEWLYYLIDVNYEETSSRVGNTTQIAKRQYASRRQVTWSRFQKDMLTYIEQSQQRLTQQKSVLNQEIEKTRTWFARLLQSKKAREAARLQIEQRKGQCEEKLAKLKEGEVVTLVGHAYGDDTYTAKWVAKQAQSPTPIDKQLQVYAKQAVKKIQEPGSLYAIFPVEQLQKQIQEQNMFIAEQITVITEQKTAIATQKTKITELELASSTHQANYNQLAGIILTIQREKEQSQKQKEERRQRKKQKKKEKKERKQTEKKKNPGEEDGQQQGNAQGAPSSKESGQSPSSSRRPSPSFF